MYLLLSWILNTLALLLAAWMIPGFDIATTGAAILAAAILGIINAIIRPILIIITLPINIITLGLFTFVINALLLLLTAHLISGFHISGFLVAVIAAIFLAIISTIIAQLRSGKR